MGRATQLYQFQYSQIGAYIKNKLANHCITTGVVAAYKDVSVMVYPNPATNQISISGLPDNFGGTITIYNTLGQVQFAEQKSGSQFNVDIAHLKTGMYFMHINGENGQIRTKKFIKNDV